jgi:hypothetical protein
MLDRMMVSANQDGIGSIGRPDFYIDWPKEYLHEKNDFAGDCQLRLAQVQDPSTSAQPRRLNQARHRCAF